MATIVPVILSGGSGTRLWPKSRKHFPKQLHKLYGEHSMLQHTALRVDHLGSPIVICNNEQRFMIADQLREVGVSDAKIILEPLARNTAPAIIVAALKALEKDDDAVIAVFAADHFIKDLPAFRDALEIASQAANDGKLVTFGVLPTKAETGYGYIELDKKIDTVSKIAQFVEKPDAQTAQKYLEAGNFYWNSGMFVFSAQHLLNEMQKLEPVIFANSKKALEEASNDLDFIRLDEHYFSQCDDISIDYALMEKTEEAFCVVLDAGWSDVGSWEALWEVSEKDENGNTFQADVIAKNTRDCFVSSEKRLVSLVGVDDLAVIDTDDALMIVKKSDSQTVKSVVQELQKTSRSELELHREVHRPWGSYDSIDSGERYQVKRITVRPGASLSLQMHHHRAEHWIVVSGTAIVQKGEEEFVLSENQSIYIPLGEKHRLTNPGKVDLHLIEVQSGSYLGEDDIVRFEDTFGRT